jgi:hypothetical protein
MTHMISRLLDRLSNYLAYRKGLLPVAGLILITINFLLRFFPENWMTRTDIFLHLGILIAILGFLLAWAL